MKKISINVDNALREDKVRKQYEQLLLEAKKCNHLVHSKEGKGNDFLGWVNLPSSITDTFLEDIQATADLLRKDCDFVVAIGIGGSYLGTKAVIEALKDTFSDHKPLEGDARVLYAGNHISEDYLYELMQLLKGRKFGLINISKSGTTTEPAIAFRLLRNMLEQQEGDDFAQKHIVAITDASKGALRTLADKQGYKTYVIPDDVGGRFSVLTPVGLLPIAVAGFDIKALVQGAKEMEQELTYNGDSEANSAEKYAAARLALYSEGKKIEILANYHPKMHYITEWWKQLYGESEGKDSKGIFPTGVNFTTDLHSMGQWIQDGERIIFETVISIDEPKHEVIIPQDELNLDGLNFIAGKRVDFVNKMAEKGTLLAHLDGNVPNMHISMPLLNEYYIGQLFYFFEKGVAIAGYLNDVNPFDQPGVEAYKKNMFALLDKPGFEKASIDIKRRLNEIK